MKILVALVIFIDCRRLSVVFSVKSVSSRFEDTVKWRGLTWLRGVFPEFHDRFTYIGEVLEESGTNKS